MDDQLQEYHSAMKSWVQDKGISITEFAQHMHYGYQHVWNLLDDRSYVTTETLGRFLVCYGEAELLKLVTFLPQRQAELEG